MRARGCGIGPAGVATPLNEVDGATEVVREETWDYDC